MGKKGTVEKKNVRLCPKCSNETLEQQGTFHGLLCCLSLWWVCGLGCLCYRFLKEDYCEPCDAVRILSKGLETRQLKLCIDDISLYEQPKIDDAIKEEQPNVVVVTKSKSE
ncbi:unnamed protein product [Auanema sp. JU1783]|nr:unnamed protein product [Auanema sp. JU1783]